MKHVSDIRTILASLALALMLTFGMTLIAKGNAQQPVAIDEDGPNALQEASRTRMAVGEFVTMATGADLLFPLDYPPDPTADIPWSGDTFSVADIQAAFNNARTTENAQLGTSTPMLTLPSQAEWDSMSDGEKALWLINRERIDRGVEPLHGLETNVTSVAQYFAQYLLDNDVFDHNADGRTPWQRLGDNPAIGACHDFLNVAENLAVFVSSATSIPLPVERAVYNWTYDDSGSSWGHRHAVLWYPYNDNSGPDGKEGFLGIGRANGGPYQGPFTRPWDYAEIIVMNIFDPCSTWDYGAEPAPTVTSITPSSGVNTGTVPITNLTGSNFVIMGNTTVALTKSGQTPITATNVTVVSESQITCDFNLTGAATGTWDVVVTNPDGQTDTLPNGFTVTVDPGIFDEFVFLPLVVQNWLPTHSTQQSTHTTD